MGDRLGIPRALSILLFSGVGSDFYVSKCDIFMEIANSSKQTFERISKMAADLARSSRSKKGLSALCRAIFPKNEFCSIAQRQNDLESRSPFSLLIPFLSPISIV